MMTVTERVEQGHGARAKVPRRDQGKFRPSSKRKGPVAILEAQAETRVPELVPIRYGRMLASPFAFFRGAAAIMAQDLARTPSTGITAQLCGDAHLSNFGVFAAPDRRLVFDLNDFDETLPGPWEWDVKRLAASIEIAMRERGAHSVERVEAVLAAAKAYREEMGELAGHGNLQVWYTRLDAESLVSDFAPDAHAAKQVEKALSKAQSRDSTRALAKLTVVRNGTRCFASRPPLLVPLRELATGKQIRPFFDSLLREVSKSLPDDRRQLLAQYRLVDMARKVVGVGSVGTRAYVALLLGRDEEDPLFLQFKEAEASVLEPFAGASAYESHGRRVVEGQRLMQAASDIFLGWYRVKRGLDGRSHDYYVRQLWDGKGSFDPAVGRLSLFSSYARMCGKALARAHARSGDRVAIAAYVGKHGSFDQAITEFATTYADLNERDYATFAAACKRGKLEAETGI